MADDPTKQQQQTPPSVRDANGNSVSNGNGHQATATREDGKYAPPKSDQDAGPPKEDDGKKPASPARKLVIGAIVVIAVIAALIWGVNYYHFSKTHVGTDDAYITGNLVNVSPIISGTLSKLTVEEGNTVKKGQLIARLEGSGPLASLRQAQAAYASANSQIPQANINLSYQEKATQADIQRAKAALAAQAAKTRGAQQQVGLTSATIQNQVKQAAAQVSQASAQASGAEAQVINAAAMVNADQQAIKTAQRAASAVAAQIAGAQANYQKAANDEKRYRTLLAQQAVTAQQYDAAYAAEQSASSQLEALRQQAAQAESQVETARVNVQAAQAQLGAARDAANASRQQVEVARAGLGTARANSTQVPIQQTNVQNNVQQGGQAAADLATAEASREQISLRKTQIATARAQAVESRAALQNARVTYNDTFIYAPNDGTVVKKAVNVGAAMTPGQTIVTITQGDYVWVEANFKETQLTDVRPGQPAEVSVDAFPGKIFKGRVQSINEASGASTALLPPDNATGNFTKVVQRIPVRIELVPVDNDSKYATAEDIRSIRQGESVTATIDTSNAQK